jgi:RNA polymerase sigma-70 factor (TIGR02957 family)
MRYDSSVASDSSDMDDGLSAFVRARPRLFGIVYRMLGSVAEAEDVVQDVWTRWQSTDRRVVRDPPAFLATTATRLSINVLQSARTRRETYVGPWLPEPVDTSADPGLGAERSEALELAVLLLLERLTPTERAAYVLREAFNYPYKEIAEVLRIEEANARQLVTRAREHVADGRRTRVSDAEQRRLLQAFIAAAQNGDLAELERLFAADVVSQADGGGFIRAAQKAVVGRERVAKYIASVSEWGWSGVTVTVIQANGMACALLSRAGVVAMLVTIEASPEGIDQIMWVMRPSKLAGVAASSPPHASTDTTDLEPQPPL